MKIKNLKMNPKVASKLATCVLVGSLSVTLLAGCSERDNLLEGTILENTCVVTFEDGSKDIVQAVGTCDDPQFNHYSSVISGEKFGSKDCVSNVIMGEVAHHYGIVCEENIIGYLTEEDIAKAMRGELEDDDILAIVNRTVLQNVEEETKNK